jgi:hypothetical protein
VAACNGILYWPPSLKGAGSVAASAILIASVSPHLAGAGSVSGKTVD